MPRPTTRINDADDIAARGRQVSDQRGVVCSFASPMKSLRLCNRAFRKLAGDAVLIEPVSNSLLAGNFTGRPAVLDRWSSSWQKVAAPQRLCDRFPAQVNRENFHGAAVLCFKPGFDLNGETRTARTKRSSPIIPPAKAIPLSHQRGYDFRYTQPSISQDLVCGRHTFTHH